MLPIGGFVTLYDASVLYPISLCDLLLRLGLTGLVRARWTDKILDECFEALADNRPDLSEKKLAHRRACMNNAIPDSLVVGYEDLVHSLALPDPDDRHVLAAAVHCSAQTIVTSNIKHFPEAELAKYHVEAQTPDEFVIHQIHLNEAIVVEVVNAQAASLRNPPRTPNDVVNRLETNGLVMTARELRRLLKF